MAFDPEASHRERYLRFQITYVQCARCREGADALAIVTEWNEFRRPGFCEDPIAQRGPVAPDGRNFRPAHMKQNGFTWLPIGRSRADHRATGGAGYIGSHAPRPSAAGTVS